MLKNVKIGDVFTWCGLEWKAIDICQNAGRTGVLAVTTTPWKKNVQFMESGIADYTRSEVRKMLLTELLPQLKKEALLDNIVDLTADDGGNRLGTLDDKVFILSDEQYRRYRRLLPEYVVTLWSVTAQTSLENNASIQRIRYANGILGGGTSHYRYSVVPACIIDQEELRNEQN